MATHADLELCVRAAVRKATETLGGRRSARAVLNEIQEALSTDRIVAAASTREVTERLDHLAGRLDELALSLQELTSDLAHVRMLAEQEVVNQDQQEKRHLDQFLHLDTQHVSIADNLGALRKIAVAQYENVYPLRTQLIAARKSARYAACYEENDPLISIRITTFNRPDLLIDRAIESVLRQTHQNFEIVVVGDGCEVETALRIAEIDDPRIVYRNLPHRGVYPEDSIARWKVAGTPAANRGAEMARGRWIAPLDEDDAMEPDHLRQLLQTALDGRHEMVYGRVRQRFTDPSSERVIGEYPPREGQFNFGGALYHATLRFFEWDPHAWVVNDPGDWHVCRQMVDAGVDIGFVDDVVTTLYVTGPRTES